MKNTPTVTKRNLVAQVSQKQKRALGRARIKRNERTGSEALGSAQVESAITADTTKRDVIQRKAKNRKRMKSARALESFVLDLDLDWLAFNDMLFGALLEVGCDGDHTLCRRILGIMGLEDEAIQACLSYFRLRGGGCDCEVIWNVDMTEPKPLVDFSCEDCEFNYDEYYMVQDDIWKAYGAGKGMLCIGCLEANQTRRNQNGVTELASARSRGSVLHVSGGNRLKVLPGRNEGGN